MDGNRTASVSRVYVPNQYTVFLSTEDHERLEGYESARWSRSSPAPARARAAARLRASDPPRGLARDRRALAPRRVRDPDAAREAPRAPRAAGAGRAGPDDGLLGAKGADKPKRSRQPGARLVETRAIVSFDDRRYVLEGPVAVLGRSRESDCVPRPQHLPPPRRAPPRPDGDWQVVDLGSTNGVKVNGRRVESSRLSPGDEVTLGTTRFVFDIEQ